MKKYLPWIAAIGFTASLIVVAPAAFAQTPMPSVAHGSWMPGMMMHGAPGVFGTVTAVNGPSLTVTQRQRPNATGTVAAAPMIYTVDATNAKVFKNGTSSTYAAIVVNDTVIVQGTVTGTNVVATMIRDGAVPMGGPGMMGPGGRGGYGFGHGASSTLPHQPMMPPTSPIQGNGQPVIGGNITAVSGTTLTVTNASNVTYTIDAASTTIIKNSTTTPFTSLLVGDRVIVQGPVNGLQVTASSIIDQGSGTPSSSPTRGPPAASPFGFFASIGGFFKHLFGF